MYDPLHPYLGDSILAGTKIRDRKQKDLIKNILCIYKFIYRITCAGFSTFFLLMRTVQKINKN